MLNTYDNNLSKNQEYKLWKQATGENMHFKEWLHYDLNNSVKEVVNIGDKKENEDFANQTGINPSTNYEPNPCNSSILGIPDWLIGTVAFLTIAIVFGAVIHSQNKKYSNI